MSDESKKLSKKFWIIACSICCFLAIFLIMGFSIVNNKKPKVVNEKLKGGNIVLNYTGNTSGLTINGMTPTSDIVGIKNNTDGSYFDFSVKVDLNKASNVNYEISIEKNRGLSTINDSDIKIYLEKEVDGTYEKVFGPTNFKGITADSKLGSKKGSMILYKNEISKDETTNYRLRLWMSDTCLMQSGNYSVAVLINGKA